MRVPYDDLSKYMRLRQCYMSTAHIWLPLATIVVDIAIITHAHVVHISYCQFRRKVVHNLYVVLLNIRYIIYKNREVELTSYTILHSNFISFANSDMPHLLHFSLYFNAHIYSSLNVFKDIITKLTHTNRMIHQNN